MKWHNLPTVLAVASSVALSATLAHAENPTPVPSVGLYFLFSGDPTISPGACTPQWQLLFRTDNNTLYYKSGAACTAWTPFAGSGAGTVSSITCSTGLTCTPNPIVASGTVDLTNTAVTPGSYTNTNLTVNQQGQITNAINGSAGISGSGSAGYYANWLTSTSLGNANIADEGSFGNTTQFFNTYNQFNHSVYVGSGDVVAGQTSPGIGGAGSGRLLSYYSVGSALGGGSANILAIDLEPVSDAPGTGGNVQFFGNTGGTSGATTTLGAELKLSKTTSSLADATFDLVASTQSAGANVAVCKLGHDGGVSLQSAGGYVQLIQATGGAATPKMTAYAGNPNTHVTGTSGDFLIDISTPAIWQSAGGTTWTEYSTTAAIPATSNLLQGTGTAGSSQASNETDNGTTFGAGADFLVTLSTGHFTGASGGYVTGNTGFSTTAAAFTPGTAIDVRVNSATPLEIFDYKTSAGGTPMLVGRGRGTIASPAAVQIGDGILSFSMYGYDSNNALDFNTQITTNVDNTVGAGVVPANFQIALQDSGGTNRNRFRIDSAGHVIYPVITTPVATSCGSSPTVVGDDANGSVTVGTAATGCTLTFGTSYATPTPASTANCVLTAQSSIVFTYAVSNTALTITSGASSSVVFNWICAGY